ncbi:uncharacterized protein G2W53_037076 [Senna tora]|uniref:Uncharacterized protein n=1 Tax=Senna tora TaxID=362788 RepID=A0A834W6Q3_9FABA|nr:uncharacterized protein G2W53_037076 [Senna tora]
MATSEKGSGSEPNTAEVKPNTQEAGVDPLKSAQVIGPASRAQRLRKPPYWAQDYT